MNRKPYPQGRRAWRWTAALAFVLLVVVLAACLPFGAGGPEPETTPLPTWNLGTETAATATAESTTEATAVTDVTATTAAATATATAEPTADEPPEVGNVGTPPADGCVVAWPGPGAAPSYVYAAPAASADIIGRVGVQRWAQVVETQGGWFKILIGPGETGWVQASAVAQNEHCGADPGPGVPVVSNPGSPPDGACSVAPADGVEMVNVRSGPGLEHGRIAVLASWAGVSNSEDGWRQIAIGDGDFGWVSGSVVDLSGPCEANPERIQFETGATSTTIEGQLDQPYRHFYVFRANAGQRLAIVVHSDTGQANFGVSGVEDGQPYKRVENESRDWWIILPTTQDYLLTIAAAGPANYQLNMEIVDGSTAPEPTRLEFDGGTTAMAWGRVEPDEQDLYVFRALAGQSGVVDVNSSSSPLFAMVGVDSGEVLKPMSTERMWEGVFPETQDYLVRIVGGDSAADYEVIVGIEPLETVAPIYDHFTGYLLGGVQDNSWVDVGATVSALSGGETYRVYTSSALMGTATGSAPEKQGGVCPGTVLSLSPAPEIEMSLGFGGDWDPAPRTPAIGDGEGVHRVAVASLLAQHGVDVEPIEVNVVQVWTVDLDNDGHEEAIIQAGRLKEGGATPAVDAGDYDVIAMIKQTENGLRTVPVAINAFPEAQELAYPWRYYVPNMLDLDGDGRLELVISAVRFEGTQTTVYVVDGDGTVRPVMSGGCAL